MARNTDLTRQSERSMFRNDPFSSPFDLLEHFLTGSGQRSEWMWTPQVEVFQRDGELVVRADLPGMNRNDINVDVAEDRITLQGERKREHEEERQGVFRSERSYGTFYREILLPQGAITDQAKASFRDGVLEITVPTPPESTRRGRRLEISEGDRVKPTVTK